MLFSIYQCFVRCILVRISYPATAAMPRFVLSIIEMQYASPDIRISRRSMRWIILCCSDGEYSSSQSTLLLAGWFISSTFSMLEGFSVLDLNMLNMKVGSAGLGRRKKSWVNSPSQRCLIYIPETMLAVSGCSKAGIKWSILLQSIV